MMNIEDAAKKRDEEQEELNKGIYELLFREYPDMIKLLEFADKTEKVAEWEKDPKEVLHEHIEKGNYRLPSDEEMAEIVEQVKKFLQDKRQERLENCNKPVVSLHGDRNE